MSTLDRPGRATLPPLVNGQRLDRASFHARYEAMPAGTRAELIGGVVHMPSPVSHGHGVCDGIIAYWLGHYRRSTPGLSVALNATTILGDETEVQPDALLRIHEDHGGRSRVVGDYLVGPPELVVEVGRSSRRLDLGPKSNIYERAGVREYLFIGIEPDEARWLVLRDGRYDQRQPDADSLLRSEVFPGLWLDPAALLAGDVDPLIAALDLGLATPEHADFAAQMRAGGPPR